MSARFSALRKKVRTSRATEQSALRFARSALNPYSVASTSSPSNSVLKFFLDCGRHIFPWLSEATTDSSDCPAAALLTL